MLIRFQDFALEQEQKDFLCLVVEASRSIPRARRARFFLHETAGGENFLTHPSLPDFQPDAYRGDIEALSRVGLLIPSYDARSLSFDVSPEGFRYYEWLRGTNNQPVQRIEADVARHLEADWFQNQYPLVFQKWREAESLLWSSDSDKQLTTIGHLCREAMQEFATSLVERFKLPNVDPDKARDISRLKSVLSANAPALGASASAFLDALASYWGTVNDLVQRQEHGSQKEGTPLRWEDARRIVFQTMVVFYEIDRSLSLRVLSPSIL